MGQKPQLKSRRLIVALIALQRPRLLAAVIAAAMQVYIGLKRADHDQLVCDASPQAAHRTCLHEHRAWARAASAAAQHRSIMHVGCQHLALPRTAIDGLMTAAARIRWQRWRCLQSAPQGRASCLVGWLRAIWAGGGGNRDRCITLETLTACTTRVAVKCVRAYTDGLHACERSVRQSGRAGSRMHHRIELELSGVAYLRLHAYSFIVVG